MTRGSRIGSLGKIQDFRSEARFEMGDVEFENPQCLFGWNSRLGPNLVSSGLHNHKLLILKS